MSATIVPKKTLYGVWLALLALLLLTWGLAQFDLHHFNVAAALGIAMLKMLLVILFFMHVKYKPPLTWIFVAAGFIWLLIMFDLTLSDYMTRGAIPGTTTRSWEHGTWPVPTSVLERAKSAPRLLANRSASAEHSTLPWTWLRTTPSAAPLGTTLCP
jgi:cytochrome c oxidase subunit IV